MDQRAEIRGTTRRRSRTWPPGITARIRELATDGVSGPAIRRTLELEFADGPLPEVRTIQDIAQEVAQPAGSIPWSLAEHKTSAADARPIMAVLGELERRGTGATLTVDEAQWVVRLVQAVPILPILAPWMAYLFARQYVARRAAGEDTRDLDRQLALGATKGALATYGPEEGKA